MLAAAVLSCTEEVQLGDNGGSIRVPVDASTGGSATPEVDAAPNPTGGGAGSAQPAPCERVLCQGMEAACGNCRDDDGDGRIDAADPECLGPCDNDEGAFTTGVMGNVLATCSTDCYFDRNAGLGDDGCSWNLRCDPLAVAPGFPPTGNARCAHDADLTTCAIQASTLAACEERCIPLTPNGCDCFGCCELPAGSGRRIWLGSPELNAGACDPGVTEGPTACPECTPAPGCDNPCDTCELCVGKTSLPASCESGALPQCGGDRSACDPLGGVGCSDLEYCITGCCAPSPQ